MTKGGTEPKAASAAGGVGWGVNEENTDRGKKRNNGILILGLFGTALTLASVFARKAESRPKRGIFYRIFWKPEATYNVIKPKVESRHGTASRGFLPPLFDFVLHLQAIYPLYTTE